MFATLMSHQPTMAALFGLMLGALGAGYLGWRRLAAACILACFFLAVWQFLFEIYDPKEGFRMPWIQTELREAPVPAPRTGA